LRIVILTTGSQGDLQPYVALGVGLQAAGHKVRVATHADFGPQVRARALEFFPIAGDSRNLHETLEGRKMLAAGSNPFAFMRYYAEMRKPLMRSLVAGCLEASRGANVIMATTTAFLPGQSVAEKLRLPMLPIHFVPNGPTRCLAHCVMPEAPRWLLGSRLYNYLSYLVVGEYFWQILGSAVNEARQEVLDLPPLPFLGPSLRLFEHVPVLYGYSPLVVPRPADLGAQHAVTGFWFLNRVANWRPPAALADFLESGPPPVSIGFGSMQCGRAAEITDLVTQALARCGQRGILLTGWGGLCPATNDRVLAVASVPHDWLFPRVAAVVHHGGAGTTAAGLRAGAPTVIVPFMADQPFWGRHVAKLGVGPEPIPRRNLTVERLARAIRLAVSDQDMRARAAALGAKLRVEDGVGTAVEAFHHFVAAGALVPQGKLDEAPSFARSSNGLRRTHTFFPRSATPAGGT